MNYFAGPIEFPVLPIWVEILVYLAFALVVYLIVHRPLSNLKIAFKNKQKYSIELVFVKFIAPITSLSLGIIFYIHNDKQTLYLISIPIISMIVLETIIGIDVTIRDRLK